jgi:SAM-dependent methyltransferase
MIENKRCLVCNSNHFIPIYSYTLLKCSKCSFITANLDVKKLNYKNIYDEQYFNGKEYFQYQYDKPLIQKNFEKRLKKVLKVVDRNDISFILEIGCAYGFFGDLIKRHFPGVKFTGLDISTEAVNFGRMELGLDLHEIDYLNFKSKNSYSDIYMWDVIEHLPDPNKVVEKANLELMKNGRLIITTGDIESYLARFQKEKWRLIHPPSHLHYFSKSSISRLLEKNNFKIIDISYQPILRSLKQSWYSMFLLNKKPNFLVKKIFNSLPDINLRINTYDIMTVIAVKQ